MDSSSYTDTDGEEVVHTHTHSHTHSYHDHTHRSSASRHTVAPTPVHGTNASTTGSDARLDSVLDVSTASTHRSVRDALAELNLKTRLLEDERDYYVNLYIATDKAYEHHRRELQSLLVKERAIFADSLQSSETKLTAMLDGNRAALLKKEEEKAQMLKDMQRMQEELKQENGARLAQLRAELAEQRTTLGLMRNQTNLLVGEKESLEQEIRDLLRRQEELRAEVLRRKAEQRALLEAQRGPKPFIPGGRTLKDEYAPASHNVNALLSTIHNRNFLLPGEHKRFKSPAAASPLEDACSAVLRELMDLRLEYHLLAEQLNDPHTDVTSASIRLREILQTVERKKTQLRKMRANQRARQDDDKLHAMLKTIAHQNNMAERLYADLITCIRTPY